MQKESIFYNNNFLVYGFGKSGYASYKFLIKNNSCKIIDDNKKNIPSKYKNHIVNFKDLKRNNFDYIVLSPGIDIKQCKLTKYLLNNQNKIITELDIFHVIYSKNTKITITGTNGKSTTCQMLFKIFKSNNKDVRLVGNIGNPPLFEKNIKKETIFIIEASSYQISYSNFFKTDHAAILNLSTDHLERHGNINNYAKAKLKLFYNQEMYKQSYIEKNNKIINKNIYLKKIKSKLNKINYDKIKFFKRKIKNSNILDKNNLNNIHFIYAICKKFNFQDNVIFESLNNFKGLKYRKQIIYDKNNLKIINDSKSTSFSSTVGLLSEYKNIYWIVGGKYKKGDRFKLNKKYYKNISAYIIGLSKSYFVKQFKNKIQFKYLKNLKKTILIIKKEIKNQKNSKIILFSPSAASFDQFKNFEERGVYFNKLVRQIILKKL